MQDIHIRISISKGSHKRYSFPFFKPATFDLLKTSGILFKNIWTQKLL